MDRVSMKKIIQFVTDNIGDFHQSRLDKLGGLKLEKVLMRRNPYLYKAKNLEIAHDFVKTLFDDFLSQQERTIFGHFLEELAIFVGKEIYGGNKSGIEGVDLEFFRDNTHYIVSIKSGPNWGNSSEVKKQTELFSKAARTIRQSKKSKNVCAILGCCFGQERTIDKGNFFKYCGQKFWDFLSGDPQLYLDIIKPLGHEAQKQNRMFHKRYAILLNQATEDFMKKFCSNGKINWNLLVKFNSEYKAK